MRHQFHHAVGQRKHPGVVGGDDDEAFPGCEFADQPQHLFDLNEVQVRGRLVGQDQRRIEGDRAGDGDALLLSAAEVTGTVPHPVLQADPLQQFLGALAGLAAVHARRVHRHHHILERGQAGEQVERLKHDADRAAPVHRQRGGVHLGDVDIVERDAARCRAEDSAEARQQRGLAAAARAEQQRQRAGFHLEVRDRRSGAPRTHRWSTRPPDRRCADRPWLTAPRMRVRDRSSPLAACLRRSRADRSTHR